MLHWITVASTVALTRWAVTSASAGSDLSSIQMANDAKVLYPSFDLYSISVFIDSWLDFCNFSSILHVLSIKLINYSSIDD